MKEKREHTNTLKRKEAKYCRGLGLILNNFHYM